MTYGGMCLSFSLLPFLFISASKSAISYLGLRKIFFHSFSRSTENIRNASHFSVQSHTVVCLSISISFREHRNYGDVESYTWTCWRIITTAAVNFSCTVLSCRVCFRESETLLEMKRVAGKRKRERESGGRSGQRITGRCHVRWHFISFQA